MNQPPSLKAKFVTFAPGDILCTGSPTGSAGVHGNRWLRPGDRIRAEIENVGAPDVTLRQNR
jgi:2-keto-4-pentenoate hydratase/2-oxohepta-3-ene-1,7-dioic acid hydratase in catechol pathway